MLQIIILMTMAAVTAEIDDSPAAQQIVNFKKKSSGPIGIMKTSAGSPIEHKDASGTLNTKLFNNEFFMDSLTHVVRERIPARVVHANAAGASGYFEVTHNITDICKAKLFSAVGKKTPIRTRFSTAFGEKGGSETSRDPRGFAVKFYTEDGNFDIVGLSTPVYIFKDPLLFPTLVRSHKKNPATNLDDVNMLWDFVTLHPEALYGLLLVFGDPGVTDGYRHMPGFSIETYEVVNEQGEKSFIRFHIIPDAGIKHLSSEQARKIAGEDPDYATRDLYNAIGSGNFPCWKISVQVVSLIDVNNANFDVFDVTRVLPLEKYPLRPLGKIVLNKNPVNYFAEVEQIAFNPANLVPGILGGPDKLFEARRFAYREAQYHRLGANFNKIRVNCPMLNMDLTYNRDGRPPVNDNGQDIPNYYPNSFNGPVPFKDKNRVELTEIYESDPYNFDQATELYINEMGKEERNRLIENILFSLRRAITELQDKAVKLFTIIHPDLGSRLIQGLQLNKTESDCS